MKKNKDNLGDRMKGFYENKTRYFLPRRTYTVIRIDGKAFHTYTRGFNTPFDDGLIEDMNNTAIKLCKEIQGAKLAFVQSDEISILLTDFDSLYTSAWFDGNIQKICSVSASIATVEFNRLRVIRNIPELMRYSVKGISDGDEKVEGRIKEYLQSFKMAEFDSRTYTIPPRVEVENYFIWRQQDATRNSISSVAQSLYSHKQLFGKSTNDMQEMIYQKGINWNDYSVRKKRGGLIIKVNEDNGETVRSKWVCVDPPIFTGDRSILNELIPRYE